MNALQRFVSEPSSPTPLALFRVGLSGLLLLQAWTLSGHLLELFGNRGWIPWALSAPMASPWMPRLDTLVQTLARLGLTEAEGIEALTLGYTLALVGLGLGWRTRPCAIAAWLLHTTLLNSGPLFIYGVELFAHLSLFYCVVMPVGEALSLDRLAGRASGEPSAAATLSLRVLQLHLCGVYLSTGIEKALGPAWREGTALWETLMQPTYARFDFSWMASYPWVSRLGSWGTLVIEIGYAVFIWPRQTRRLWVGLTLGLHLGIAVLMGLWMFSATMAMLTFCAFGWEALVGPRPHPTLFTWKPMRGKWTTTSPARASTLRTATSFARDSTSSPSTGSMP